MGELEPSKLVLKCYGHPTREGRYFGVCLNLNVAVEAVSIEELQSKMSEAIISYIETVLDTVDKASVPELLCRRAPLRDWLIYYFIKAAGHIKKFPGNFTFKEFIPFHLVHSC